MAKVIGARFDPAGTLTGIDVFGAPGSKAPSQRTLRPERLGPVNAPRKSRHRKEG